MFKTVVVVLAWLLSHMFLCAEFFLHANCQDVPSVIEKPPVSSDLLVDLTLRSKVMPNRWEVRWSVVPSHENT